MKILKWLILLLIIISLTVTALLIIQDDVTLPFTKSFSPLFQELGKPIKSADRVISKILPIDSIDEKALGEEIENQIKGSRTFGNKLWAKPDPYLTALIQFLTKDSSKPFKYRIYTVKDNPNAFAYPGGVILITTGMLKLVKNEAELVSVLGHEIGHIELGHCFDIARGTMLNKKKGIFHVATYASDMLSTFAKCIFSKAQEDEADEYGFKLLTTLGYDPNAMSNVFKKLTTSHTHNLFGDFISSHPYPEQRQEKWHARARQWVIRNQQAQVYWGKRNLRERTTLEQTAFPEEFHSLKKEYE